MFYNQNHLTTSIKSGVGIYTKIFLGCISFLVRSNPLGLNYLFLREVETDLHKISEELIEVQNMLNLSPCLIKHLAMKRRMGE
jgi:hypothetical protein